MFRDRPRFAARRRTRLSRPRAAAASAPQRTVTLDRLLALPAVDRTLNRLLNYPRALQWVGILVGLLMVVLALYPLMFLSSRPAASATVPAAVATVPVLQSAPSAPSDQEVLALVAAYNQASITAAVLNKPDPMAAYLAPDGKAWTEVQAEYERRTTRGETHDAALTRWGVLKIVVDGDTATVETQEQWDDVMSVGGEVISSKRGILTRNTYTLRRSPSLGRWLIMAVISTLVIG